MFILATTDVHKVPATIVSRCQRHEFSRIPLSAMVARLQTIAEAEGLDVPHEGLELISRTATGSLRDAINLMEQVCDSYGSTPSLEAVREGLGLIADERAAALALQALHGDFPSGLETIGSVRDDGLDLKQFQKEVVMRLRELLHVKSGANTEGLWTDEQVEDMRASIADVPRERLVEALRAFGLADLRADPLSPLPLELALADATAPATKGAEPASEQPMQRPAPQPGPRPAPAQSRQTAALPAEPKIPVQLRKDLSNASAEDIAKMLGSKKPVIPPAGDEPTEAATAPPPAPAAANGAHVIATAGGTIDLDTFVDHKLRPLAKQRSQKLDALLNGSCRAVSFEGGVLELGFFMDAHHKKTVEQPATRKIYEELASQLLGEPVTIRCILSPRPAKAIKSPLVEHAVKTHGAKIVSGDEEP
jgi:DNA polymerase-3 subunit gamma/tau